MGEEPTFVLGVRNKLAPAAHVVNVGKRWWWCLDFVFLEVDEFFVWKSGG